MSLTPQLTESGYNFSSVGEIEPHLEPSGAGATSVWARTVAMKYGCTVVCPYAEKTMGGSVSKNPDSAVSMSPNSTFAKKSPSSSVDRNSNPAVPENYNSAIIVDSAGATAGHYRKRHLYEIDEAWASEGPPLFFYNELPGLGSVAMGMSMDLKYVKKPLPSAVSPSPHELTRAQARATSKHLGSTTSSPTTPST